jgi:putative PIN family toxin of toxin-antitoxin system
MIHAVLDTNVLVSAQIKAGGNPDRILRQGQAGKFELLTSEFILAELADVLGRRHIQRKYKSQVTASKRAHYLRAIRAIAGVVQVTTEVQAVPDDLEDNAILACGVDGQANYIVTGDDVLLELGTFQGIQIVTPAQFLQILKTQ